MFDQLPEKIDEFMAWGWQQISPFYKELRERPLTANNVTSWLKDWTRLNYLLDEWQSRLFVATTQDTSSGQAETALNQFMAQIYPYMEMAENSLKQRLLESGLQPAGMELVLQKMTVEADLFQEDNIPLLAELSKLNQRYHKIIGSQTVTWQDEELTLTQLTGRLQSPDRHLRQAGWQVMAVRQQHDRLALNSLWRRMFLMRCKVAQNAGLSDFRAYSWRHRKRFDYSPEDAATFHAAILAVAVPAASRIYERYRQKLGVDKLRPWDVNADVYPYELPAIRPFANINELTDIASYIFQQVDPLLGEQFKMMRQEGALDLPNRKNKAPGAFSAYYPVTERPFIFMNSIGTGQDIRILLHEAGHAFHYHAMSTLPYHQQAKPPMEFAEVSSMAMELLAIPYLAQEKGGFFSSEDAAHWCSQHLEKIILFWPYMAVVDAFQHWAYTSVDGSDAAACDAKWGELWQQFIPDIDYSGVEDVMVTGWHRKSHIFRIPFYYIEYGLAQLGALQVWRNAMQDQAGAMAAYWQALALGGTRPLPELYATANTRFAFDEPIMAEMVAFLEEQLASLQKL